MYKALQVITTTHKPSHHFPFVQNILGKLRCNLESNTYLGLTLAYCHGLNVYLANVPWWKLGPQTTTLLRGKRISEK